MRSLTTKEREIAERILWGADVERHYPGWNLVRETVLAHLRNAQVEEEVSESSFTLRFVDCKLPVSQGAVCEGRAPYPGGSHVYVSLYLEKDRIGSLDFFHYDGLDSAKIPNGPAFHRTGFDEKAPDMTLEVD